MCPIEINIHTENSKLLLSADPEVKELIKKKDESVSRVFLSFSDYNSVYKEDRIYCFVEGYDDRFFYDRKVKNITNQEACFIPCSGRQQVIAIHNKLTYDSDYASHSLLFFIDADYVDNSSVSEDIFITDGISIENYFCSEEVMRKILRKYYEIDPLVHKSQYDCLIQDFRNWRNVFFQPAIEYCAFFNCMKDNTDVKNLKWEVNLPTIKYNSDNNIERNPMSLDQLNQEYNINPPITDQVFKQYVAKLTKFDHIYGKYVKNFMINYLKHLKKSQKSCADRHFALNSKILCVDNRNFIEHLADCADDSPRLNNYIIRRITHIS